MIRTEGFDVASQNVAGEANTGGADLIEQIAFHLTPKSADIECDLLRKSVQELLFMTVGPNADASRNEIADKLAAFINRRGTEVLVRRFISVHIFNIVWFQTGERFRALAPSANSFLADIEDVEGVCRRIVFASWTLQKRSGAADSQFAANVIKRVARELTE